jgi:flagellin
LVLSNMVVRTNISSLSAHRNMKNTGLVQRRAANRLSSGYRINSAADDAAGLAISETMRAQIRGLDQASRNTQDGISLVQTAEGALQGINDKLGRIRELVVQAANDTYRTAEQHVLPDGTVQHMPTTVQREMIQQEINQLMIEINDTVLRVEFNGMRLLDGTAHPIRMPEFNIPAQTFIEDSFNLLAGIGGSRTQIGNLYDEFMSIVPPGTAAQLQSITSRLFNAVTTADAAHNQIIDFVAGIDPAEFDPVRYAAWLSLLDHHIYGIGHNPDDLTFYEAYLEPALRGIQDAITALGVGDLDEAHAQLFIAFRGDTIFTSAGGHPIGGAWGGGYDEHGNRGIGMVFCNHKIAHSAWDLLRGVAIHIPAIPGRDGLWLQTGANSLQGVKVTIAGMSTLHLGAPLGDFADMIDVENIDGRSISAQLDIIDRAIPYVLHERAKLGAMQNRLEFAMRSLDISSENLQDSESRIRNADIARTMMDFTKMNVLFQAGTSMLAQANQLPNSILELLR